MTTGSSSSFSLIWLGSVSCKQMAFFEAEPGQHKLGDKLEILKQLTQSMQKKSQEALLSSLISFLYFTENHRILKRSSSSTCPKPYNPNRSSALCWSIPNAE